MSRFPLFDQPLPEPSAATGFAGNRLDRRSEQRSDDSAAQALRDPGARLLLIGEGRVWTRPGGEFLQPFFSVAEAEPAGALPADAVLLGWDETGPVLAAAIPVDTVPPEGTQATEIRGIHSQGLLGADAAGALAQGAALLSWHRTHRFCGRCGNATDMRNGGAKRVCPICGAEHFPRTDPVAIMLAVLPPKGKNGERCLLGRGRHFPPGMLSCLAGFIEGGETVEDAVRRETFEESGIRLGRVSYHASQPWPFPHSLMIGCFGEALNEDVTRDEAELEDCRWFSRDEVRLMLERRHPDGLLAPPDGAIATHLIRAWAEGDR